MVDLDWAVAGTDSKKAVNKTNDRNPATKYLRFLMLNLL
jgi:hypothetical protein